MRRLSLFAGAFVTVALGVALLQSSLLLLISAAVMKTPAGLSPAARMAFEENASAAVPLLGITLGVATFLAVFIISSTFAFTVEQRRRDLALLRLAGASRGQVRRRLTGEAVLLGLTGAVAGIPAGLGVMAIQTRLLRGLGFVPEGFTAQWRPWILGVSLGAGVLLAVAGVLAAARRGSRVRPLEALRETGAAGRAMTLSRGIGGLVFLGGALALIIVSPHGGPAGGQAMAANVPMCAAVAVAAFAPWLVPAIARLLPFSAGSPARANLIDAARRSASVAAPVIVLTGLVLGQAGATTSFAASGVEQMRRVTHADLVVTATGPVGAKIAAVPGVASASTELAVPVAVTTGAGTEDAETETVPALVVDPSAYMAAHPGSGSLTALHGRVVAGGPGGDFGAAQTVRVNAAGTDLGTLPITMTTPAGMSGGADLLLPYDLLPPTVLAQAPAQSFVTLDPGAPTSARAALSRIGTVSDVDDWLAADTNARTSTSTKIMTVILGLGALYALIGVINSVVIGAAARRREFAAARVTGMTRGQVVGSALAESAAVTVAGLVLGVVAAAGAWISVLATTKAVTGVATLDLPWTLIATVAAGALLVTTATSLITTTAATHARPVALLAARE
jgi:putative ABC transport system permease protein